ncbi:MAG: DUF6737 family protein [Prochlorotrichaceae cyanobacterium]
MPERSSLPENLENPPIAVNIWQWKPWWCQPWSIVLTGCSLIMGSWLVFHRIWITGFIGVPVMTWMIFFLVIYPRLILNNGHK